MGIITDLQRLIRDSLIDKCDSTESLLTVKTFAFISFHLFQLLSDITKKYRIS